MAEAAASWTWMNQRRGVVLDADEVYLLFENIAHSLEIADLKRQADDAPLAVVDALPAGDVQLRAVAALEAAWEIDAMADAILREIEHHNVEGTQAMRGMVVRVREVAGIVMSAMSEEAVTLRELRLTLTGQHDDTDVEVPHG